METAVNTKVEDIFPLSFLQKALLFHNLYESRDQGITQASCALEGALDIDLFRQAWQTAIQRHPALRTSIHWEKIEYPVQVIKSHADVQLDVQDLKAYPEKEQVRHYEAFKYHDKRQKLDLNKAPVFRLTLFQKSPTNFWLVWTSHHILYDGWSAGIILNDVFEYYDALVNDQPIQQTPLPSYKQYLNWLKQQDKAAARNYWEERLQDLPDNQLFASNSAPEAANPEDKKEIQVTRRTLTDEEYERLKAFILRHRITLNTLMQGLWGLLLSRYFKADEAIFGTTVSGRFSVTIPDINKMVGLFTNVIPVRLKTDPQQALGNWLNDIQLAHTDATPYDYVTLDEITNWIAPGSGQPLLNNLLVIQNANEELVGTADIKVSEQKGEPITAYPLMLNVLTKGTFKYEIYYFTNSITPELGKWFADSFQLLLKEISALENVQLATVTDLIPEPPFYADERVAVLQESIHAFMPPANHTELGLLKIWEKLLNTTGISVNDDFFLKGGTSLLAIKLFAQIEAKFKKKLPPISLVKHRTIETLAPLITEEAKADWSTLIPLKASGDGPPVFCLHGGDGFVFFYQQLARQIEDHPIYAIQPKGLNGREDYHHSIEEMAAFYINEIKKVYPEGPYIFLSYCFSNAICLEIGKQLVQANEPVPILIIVDSAPPLSSIDHVILLNRANKHWKYLAYHFVRFNWKTVYDELAVRFLPENFGDDDFKEKRRIRKVRQHLFPIIDRYLWPEFAGNAAFIRSTEFANMPAKDYHLEVWGRLIQGDLRVYTIESTHLDIFAEPAVYGLAEKVQAFLRQELASRTS